MITEIRRGAMSTRRVEEIRRDLRELRRLTHSIESMLTLRDNHTRRITYLRTCGPGAAAEIERINAMLESLKIKEAIAKANELEARYMGTIGRLDASLRTVIIEGYINGKPYWKIGKEMGYSERSVQAKANAALEKLSKMI